MAAEEGAGPIVTDNAKERRGGERERLRTYKYETQRRAISSAARALSFIPSLSPTRLWGRRRRCVAGVRLLAPIMKLLRPESS